MRKFNTKDTSALSDEDIKRIRRSAVIKLIVSCIFVVAVIFFNTISWFVDTKDANADGMGVMVESDQGYDVKYRAYKYDLRNEQYNEITNSPEGLVLNEYDAIFTERNHYAGILLRFEVYGNFQNVSPPLPVLRITRDLSLHDENSDDIFVSDVTQFQVANEDDCHLDSCLAENSSEKLWDKALEYFFDDDGHPASTIFTDNDSVDLGFTPSDGRKTVLWMFVNYDSELVQEKLKKITVTLNELVSVDPDCTIIKLITS